jgi:hypothetical protein
LWKHLDCLALPLQTRLMLQHTYLSSLPCLSKSLLHLLPSEPSYWNRHFHSEKPLTILLKMGNISNKIWVNIINLYLETSWKSIFAVAFELASWLG